MKLIEIWFCGNRSMAKGASKDRLTHLLICRRQTSGSPRTACQQQWMTGLAGERESLEGRGSTKVDLVVVVIVVVVTVAVVAAAVAAKPKGFSLPHWKPGIT